MDFTQGQTEKTFDLEQTLGRTSTSAANRDSWIDLFRDGPIRNARSSTPTQRLSNNDWRGKIHDTRTSSLSRYQTPLPEDDTDAIDVDHRQFGLSLSPGCIQVISMDGKLYCVRVSGAKTVEDITRQALRDIGLVDICIGAYCFYTVCGSDEGSCHTSRLSDTSLLETALYGLRDRRESLMLQTVYAERPSTEQIRLALSIQQHQPAPAPRIDSGENSKEQQKRPRSDSLYNEQAKRLRNVIDQRPNFVDDRTEGHSKLICREPGCGKTFARQFTLNRHTRDYHQKHAGDPRPFKCTVEGCEISFTREDARGRHVDTHTKAGYALCEYCRGYFRPDYFWAHLQAAGNHACRHAFETRDTSTGKEVESRDDNLSTNHAGAQDPIYIQDKCKPSSVGRSTETRLPSFVSLKDHASSGISNRLSVTDSQKRPFRAPTIHQRPTRRPMNRSRPLEVPLTKSNPEPADQHPIPASVDKRQSLFGPRLMPNEALQVGEREWPVFFDSAECDFDSMTDDMQNAVNSWHEAQERATQGSPENFSSVSCRIRELLGSKRSSCASIQPRIGGSCTICSQKLGQSKKDIYKHARSHLLQPPEPKYSCPDCEVAFVFKKDLGAHLLHHSEASGASECDQMVIDDEDWVGTAMQADVADQRTRFESELRVWEKAQLYQYLESIDDFLRGRPVSDALSIESLPLRLSRSSAIFARWSMISYRSCFAQIRYDEKLDMQSLLDRFARSSLASTSSEITAVSSMVEAAAQCLIVSLDQHKVAREGDFLVEREKS